MEGAGCRWKGSKLVAKESRFGVGHGELSELHGFVCGIAQERKEGCVGGRMDIVRICEYLQLPRIEKKRRGFQANRTDRDWN